MTGKSVFRGAWTRHLTAVLLGAALVGWSGSIARAAEPVTDANVDAALASAKTPEEHAALAAYFTSKAEAAMANAEKHEQMAKSFGGSKSMAQHCANLASDYRKQAKEYTALAKAQNQLASGKTSWKHKQQ
jgi:hypothetical protein